MPAPTTDPRTTTAADPRSVRPIVLRRLNRWQAEKQREDLADLYLECRPAVPGTEFEDRAGFLRHLVADARHAGFDLVLAEAKTLVGFAFGVPVDRDGHWWQGFVGELPARIEQLTASGHVFAVTELAVHPYVTEPGVAGHLVERLLSDNRSSLGAVLLREDDRWAGACFRSLGWEEIGVVQPSPGAAPYRALVVEVGERSPVTPGGLTHDPRTQRPAVT
ncbi:hypothetical protein [Streptacidiphilus albus]|uniref:hypothetical protein n=1 Tax=Streptacidiphilus albus TaxID=105425 RepID=UPI000691E284|nr:hypothetical protein [Streptacidiphilus albus]